MDIDKSFCIEKNLKMPAFASQTNVIICSR